MCFGCGGKFGKSLRTSSGTWTKLVTRREVLLQGACVALEPTGPGREF